MTKMSGRCRRAGASGRRQIDDRNRDRRGAGEVRLGVEKAIVLGVKSLAGDEQVRDQLERDVGRGVPLEGHRRLEAAIALRGREGRGGTRQHEDRDEHRRPAAPRLAMARTRRTRVRAERRLESRAARSRTSAPTTDTTMNRCPTKAQSMRSTKPRASSDNGGTSNAPAAAISPGPAAGRDRAAPRQPTPPAGAPLPTS